MTKIWQFFTTTLFACLAFGVSHATSQTNFYVSNDRIIDETGRESFFHGVNVVYKSPPYLPITDHFDANLSFSDEDMQLLYSLGQNIIRLGVEWPGVMPQQNTINQSYINKASTLISKAYNNYNIHTLVDSHQDVLSPALCGEGAAVWATQPNKWNFPMPLHLPFDVDNDTHIPSRSDCLSIDWAAYYTTEAASTAFEAIYKNKNGLTDSYALYWGTLAKAFKNVSGIVGFELMNEPWAGDIYKNPFLMYPGVADKKNLAPFYDALVPSIYGNDSNRIVFFESVTWTDEFNISLTETGFDQVPGGSKYSDKSVFSFHYYTSPNTGNIDKYFYERTHDGIKWNSTSFLTEFDISSSFDTMSGTMEVCDQYFVSWIGWEYKPFAGSLPDGTCTGCGYGLFTPQGNLNNQTAKGVSRTYAMKVAGRTNLMKLDRNTGNFTLIYEINTSITDPTVIYRSRTYWYPNGYNLAVSDETLVTNVSTDGEYYINLYNTKDSSMNGKEVTVTIIAK